ncbi:MAG: nitrilase [Bacteroidetes bacterium GWE2_39_28]|nr:MAG: nitrilase [Bacteroidetes bacterium GWE2_39_28]OFY15141.1 MAG: nitrilase [Bacteroidetes bacterium GWF2_39_10]OFZ08315.1 MAG: nitrilase [Bacteroidetes bacterium RIFOXYB2_FULL_39_7]OFZ10993.1 MAG: nitrilase [Bacteroidetes bacterium RIFOXYC2_FULL_39_11]HCT93761.1 nitrilase [Rikenellaceae bacterium]
MKNIKISTVQFENRSGDKGYNLDVIERFAAAAAIEGSDAVVFHECSVTGYSFARNLSPAEMLDLSEPVPGGSSVKRLEQISAKYKIAVLAGLFERDEKNDIYKAYVCVDDGKLIAKHRKLHPFINPEIKPGNSYTIFDLRGWRCGILICYDNNVVENVRATKLLGAEIIFMPHVTMCTPSARPGSGFVDPQLWFKKAENQEVLRSEFNGPKGREWLMRWLPSRAHDNAVYAVFSNPIGMDDDQLKNGCSMILDPFGDIIAECTELGDCLVTAELSKDKLTLAGGHRYTEARRPELYSKIIGQEHKSVQKVAWINPEQPSE